MYPCELVVFNAKPADTATSKQYTLQSLLIIKIKIGLLKGYGFWYN